MTSSRQGGKPRLGCVEVGLLLRGENRARSEQSAAESRHWQHHGGIFLVSWVRAMENGIED